MMVAFENIRFVSFAVPLLNPPFCNRNTLLHDQTSRLICLLNTSGQKICKSADALSRSGHQVVADRIGPARAQGTWESSTPSKLF